MKVRATGPLALLIVVVASHAYGSSVQLAESQGAAFQDAVADGTHLYSISYGSLIRKMELSTGALETLHDGSAVSNDVTPGKTIGLDSDTVYWANRDGLWKIPKAGGTATLLKGPMDHKIDALAITANHIIYAMGGHLRRITKNGAGDEGLLDISQDDAFVVADANRAYVISGGPFGCTIQRTSPGYGEGGSTVWQSDVNHSWPCEYGFALSNGYFYFGYKYWPGDSHSELLKLPVTGGTPTVLVNNASGVGQVTVIGDYVYFEGYPGGSGEVIKYVSTNGGSVTTLIPFTTDEIEALAPSPNTHLYWAQEGSLWKGVADGDFDGDGLPDVQDNCVNVPNASPNDCDTDNDGYGNACDGDFDQDYFVFPSDYDIWNADSQTGYDTSGTGTDMDCDGYVFPGDYAIWLRNASSYGFPGPGPSGLACAGQPNCD